MAVSINFEDAESALLLAFRSRCTKNDEISVLIKGIINGTHKTYRYILVNGLLAKATNNEVNPLVLQAGSSLSGAFDARSLCHKVLVPFERDFLNNALGGSNEPFLNKPARFKELSLENAVRKGNDKETLKSLIEVFKNISSSQEAQSYLACGLKFLEEKIEILRQLHDSNIKYNPTNVEVYEFIRKFISRSFEGETFVIVVSALEKLFYAQFKGNYKVIAHKVNQSGASSKEIGDIDVYLGNNIFCSIEVKDKAFSAFDIGHAFKKMFQSGCEKGQFIYGPNTSFQVDDARHKIAEYESNFFFTYFDSIFNYSRVILFKMHLSDKKDFVQSMMDSAKEINAKQMTKEWMQRCLTELSWK